MARFQDGTSDEVVGFVARVTGGSSNDASRMLASLDRSFLVHTEPKTEVHMELITMHSRGGGVSRKPSNFVLNWRRFFDLGPDVLMASWAAEGPYRSTVVALYLWNKIRSGIEVEVPDAPAVVMEALWLGKGDRVTIPQTAVNGLISRHCASCGFDPLESDAIDGALEWLEQHGCIKVDADKVWLREWAKRRI